MSRPYKIKGSALVLSSGSNADNVEIKTGNGEKLQIKNIRNDSVYSIKPTTGAKNNEISMSTNDIIITAFSGRVVINGNAHVNGELTASEKIEPGERGGFDL